MTRTTFVDPCTKPAPPWTGPRRRPARDVADVAPLVAAVKAGHFSQVEAWIAAGKPLQFKVPTDPRKTPLSPLCAAIDTEQYDLVLLLLCNGCRPGLEDVCPFSAALNVRRHDIVDFLLARGAKPSSACTELVR